MRPQQNRRVRGRNNNNNGNNNNNRRGPNPLSRNYESSGPDVKIRGNAQQIADKYISLARDAQGAGDRVMSENYLQHAEHYLRIILATVGQTQYVRRDEANEQECIEISAEGEKKEIVDCDTDDSQMLSQKSSNGQHVKAQNGHAREDALGHAREDALEANTLLNKKTIQEKCTGEETVEPVKKMRRPSRRRTMRVQEEESLEFPHFELPEASQNEDTSTEKVASLPVLDKEIQRKPRRRRVVTSSAEENV
ncbi:DUF4167 domain-containing protein [Bartonella alsatica]|uniref:DUF4167 domain-containing protein n=2 Tax=Bartonella alsatica TaxID=52764 RepID=J1IRH7_9HYPH|nr:DUF4167 domain-containing protein [Bartonella alsatica]EJF74117.1 hypothetical protein MEC_01359 [Bartonella alsatica IBS 382]QLC51846.1 DUF4167 domain-containing protein [Bartonella alsatica]